MDLPASARRFDPIRLVARLLCVFFGLIGALPLGGELLLSHDSVERWVAAETARLVRDHLGVEARYDVRLRLIPLGLRIDQLEVPSSDGLGPALRVEHLRVRPRLFSLLAGKLDLGAVEIDGLRARAVVRDGKVVNVRYRLPETEAKGPAARQAPFDSLSLSDARVDVDVDGTRVSTGPMDLDVFAEKGPAFEVVLRAGESGVARTRSAFVPGAPDVERRDHDAICRLELRARVAGRELLVRRLSLLGVADLSGESKRPSCQVAEDAPERVALRLSQAQLTLSEGRPASGGRREPEDQPRFGGRVFVRAPLALTNRFARTLPLGGFAAFSGDVRFDGKSRLPEIRGRLDGRGIQFERYRLAEQLDVEVNVSGDVVQVPRYRMRFADGDVEARGARIEPFAEGVPISVERVEGDGMSFPGLMRDLGVTPDTLVAWHLTKTLVSDVRGKLSPLGIDAQLSAETRDFEITDRAHHDPARRHMIGVRSARLAGKIGVRPNALLFYDQRANFGKSQLLVKLVSIGFDNQIELDIPASKLELADVTPLVTVPWSGTATLEVKMRGISSDPRLTGNLSIAGFEMGGFPMGDVERAEVEFRPLWVKFHGVEAKKGSSRYSLPAARLDFETRASMLVEARAQSDAFDIRDFMSMWHFDEDPRFEAIQGRTSLDARIRYVLGGPEDRCGGGVLKVSGKVASRALELFEERYDRGDADFDFLWDDRDASYRGVTLRMSEIALGKGSGSITGNVELIPGARISGQLVASGVPLAEIDSLPGVLRAASGTANATATLSGSLDALSADADVTLSRVGVGRASLPPSALHVRLEPIPDPPESEDKTRCGQPRSGVFDRAKYDRDLPQGRFHTSGEMFGGQVVLDDIVVTRQRKKTVRGALRMAGFDVGAALELVPGAMLASGPVTGTASGKLVLEELRLAEPAAARGTLELQALALERGGYRVALLPETRAMSFGARELVFPAAAFALATPRGQRTSIDVAGKLAGLGARPTVDAEVSMRPTPLAGLVGVLPGVERASGTLGGRLRLIGPLREPRYSGGVRVENGELALRRFATPISDIDLRVSLDAGEVSLTKATARIGTGTLSMAGGAPLRGLSLGEARLNLTLRGITLPLDDGVHSVADAELLVSWNPSAQAEARRLPRVAGNVLLHSLEYRRAVTMTADLDALARRGKRTEFETYDRSEDFVAFDLNIKAKRPLELENELIEARLVLPEEGLELAGTNGRFGARGTVSLQPGGRIMLRRSEFEVTEGSVRFDDLDRIEPQVDVTAVTEYRRYSDAPGSSEGGASTSTVGSSSSATGGRWSIRMHAYGDADNLHVDLTSDPALPQDDIFLLLTVGLTRAELDQTQSASVGESVALEALGTLTGADRAVKDVVPVIDEFSFGSAYSSRTGRTEPTVTIGKRLTQRVRGNVTTGLAESREIRSNVEWQLSPRVSVEGSYDNVNDISSSSLGNLGADIRWRLEFE